MNDLTTTAMSRENAAGLKLGGGKLISINTAAEAADFARMMASADIALPKHLRARPGVCLAVVIQAVQWDADPFQVANKSYVVNDRLAYEAQLYAALLLSSGLIKGRPRYTYNGDAGSTRRCTVTLHLTEGGDPVVYTSPEVGKITPKNSPLWKTDEDQQLAYYSIRACGRRDFPDVLLGFLSTDEAAAMPADAAPVKETTPVRSSTVDKLNALAGQGGAAVEEAEEAEVIDEATGEVTTAAPAAEPPKAAEPEKPKAARGRKPAAAKQEPAPQPTQQERVAEAASHPTVQAAINAFPGAQVSDVRLNEDAGDEIEVEQPADAPAPSADDDPFDEFDEPAPTETVDPEEERILTRLGDMDGVPSWIDDVKLGRQFLAGHDVATQGRPLSTIPAEMRSDPSRSLECQAWAAGHDFVTGDSSEKRRERKAAREKAQQQR